MEVGVGGTRSEKAARKEEGYCCLSHICLIFGEACLLVRGDDGRCGDGMRIKRDTTESIVWTNCR